MPTRRIAEVCSELVALAARQAALTAELAAALLTAAPPPPASTTAEPSDAPAYLTTAEAAALLGVSVRTLESLRAAGTGPRFVRVGRAVRYPREALFHAEVTRPPERTA